MSSESDPSTPPHTPNPGKPPADNISVPSKPTVPTVTSDDCYKNLKRFIDGEKTGLKVFYNDEALKAKATSAAVMVNELLKMKCGKEIAQQLSLLSLYDIVMLLDDSASMESEENGLRKKTLQNTMKAITSVYDLANPDGLLSVRFFNSEAGYKKVKQKNLSWLWKKFTYGGVTRIGSSLSEKVLDRFVWIQPKMTKPLLVMMVTDGAVEGEREGLLRDVIADCVDRLERDPGLNKDAVAFHFSNVGNDEGAMSFLKDLDDHDVVGKYVDCLDVNIRLQTLPKDKWSILPKLLLGAITDEWDDRDKDVDVKVTKESGSVAGHVQEDEEAGEDEDADEDSDSE